MKVLKGISLFFIYPAIMLGIGFLGGVTFMNHFYPGQNISGPEASQNQIQLDQDWEKAALDNVKSSQGAEEAAEQGAGTVTDLAQHAASQAEDKPSLEAEAMEAAALSERLNADTVYVLEETDVRNQSVVETTWKVPAKYIGMNREQFLQAMSDYELSPPLAELERGFVSLEVLSFSREKVVVQMNYEYTLPSSSFYLMVENNYVVVYLDDRQTVYMDTDILLTDLPSDVQQDIINVMFIPNEESLYNFLETYSS